MLKEGIYSDDDEERYGLVIAFRHVGQQTDIDFFREHLGERHVPSTEALVVPGPSGPVTLIVQEKIEGKLLNEIDDLADLTAVQREELSSLIDGMQETYDETGRLPDIHGRSLTGRRRIRKADMRYTDNIIVGEKRVYLVDTDDISRNHSVETFRGWLSGKIYSRNLRNLKTELQQVS